LLADELDECKGRGNKYVDEHIKKIQELYKEKGEKQWKDRKGKEIQDDEVLLYKPYKILMKSSSI